MHISPKELRRIHFSVNENWFNLQLVYGAMPVHMIFMHNVNVKLESNNILEVTFSG